MLPFPARFLPPLGPRKQTAQQRILAQWRGVDLNPLERARELRAKPVADFLPKVLADLRIDNRRAEAEVVRVWKEALHPEIVAHAQPTGLRKGTLFVAVD